MIRHLIAFTVTLCLAEYSLYQKLFTGLYGRFVSRSHA